MKKFLLIFFSAIVLSNSLASALIISNIEADVFSPGENGALTITITNDEDRDLRDISFALDLTNVPFSSLGGSEDSLDKIKEDDDEKFSFTLRAEPNAKPGDYKIPYILSENQKNFVKRGTIGVAIDAPSELEVTTSLEKPVIGEKGKINVKIINRGQSDAKYSVLEISPKGYTLFSEDKLYIGTVSSDDFETASFDVLFRIARPALTGTLSYKDFNNKEKQLQVNMPLIVYTKEKALELGILEKNNTILYTTLIAILIVIWLIWRAIKKRRRLKKSMINQGG